MFLRVAPHRHVESSLLTLCLQISHNTRFKMVCSRKLLSMLLMIPCYFDQRIGMTSIPIDWKFPLHVIIDNCKCTIVSTKYPAISRLLLTPCTEVCHGR